MAGVPASGSPAQPASRVHLNDKADTKQGVPDDWEGSDGKSSDVSQTEASSGPAVSEVGSDSKQTGAATENTDATVSPAQSADGASGLHSSSSVSQAADSTQSGANTGHSIA